MRPIDGCSRLVVIAASLFAACDGDDTVDPSSLVETVVVIPGVVSLTIGDTMRLTTIARGDIGNPLAGRPVVWETSSASVVTVSQAGLVTGVGAGAANITATIEGKAGVASVTVSPPPFTNQMWPSLQPLGAVQATCTVPTRSPSLFAPCAVPDRASSCSTDQAPPTRRQRTGNPPLEPPTIEPSLLTAYAAPEAPATSGGKVSRH